MGWRYAYRRVAPKAELDGIRKVALDAMLEGRIDDGEKLLSSAGIRLTKPQAKLAAKTLLAAGDVDKASRVLVGAMGEEAAKRELTPAPIAKVGDILYSSWGYEQTNLDWYQIIAVSGAMATIREIAGRVVERGQYDNLIAPAKDQFTGPPKRVRVQKGYRTGEYQIKVGDRHAWQWDGKPHRETAAGYGH